MITSILVVITLLSFAPDALADVEREAKPRGKGVGLYSWKNDENEWFFAIIESTNVSPFIDAKEVKIHGKTRYAMLLDYPDGLSIFMCKYSNNASWLGRLYTLPKKPKKVDPGNPAADQ